MSWFTVSEIVVWLVLAAGVGMVLGWLLHEVWNRERVSKALTPEPAEPTGAEAVSQIKGKKSSMIYHVPGSPLYERTHADVWFESEEAARQAGFRKPKNQ